MEIQEQNMLIKIKKIKHQGHVCKHLHFICNKYDLKS